MDRPFPFIVVDQNCRQRADVLHTALDRCCREGLHLLVPDGAAMELSKGNSRHTWRRSLEVLAKYPEFVSVSQSLPDLMREEVELGCSCRDIVHHGGSTLFREFLTKLAENPEEALDNLFDSQAAESMEQSLVCWSNHEQHKRAIGVFYNYFCESLLPEIQKRLRKSTSDGMQAWLGSHEGLAMVFQHLQRQGADASGAIRLSFTLSISAGFLSGLMLIALRWLAKGGFEGANSAKITNDLYDLEYAILGSLCVEMLSEDKGSIELTSALRWGAEARENWFRTCFQQGVVAAPSISV